MKVTGRKVKVALRFALADGLEGMAAVLRRYPVRRHLLRINQRREGISLSSPSFDASVPWLGMLHVELEGPGCAGLWFVWLVVEQIGSYRSEALKRYLTLRCA